MTSQLWDLVIGEKPVRRSVLAFVVLLAGGAIIGCGGGDDTETVGPALKSDGLQGGGGPRGQKQAHRARPTRRRKADWPSYAGLEMVTDSSDVFDIVGSADDWEIVNREFEGDETRIAAVPSDGVTSADFSVVSVPRERGDPRRFGNGTGIVGKASSLLPDGFTAVAESGVSPAGLPWRIVCDNDGAEMALVPGGVCVRGTSDGPSEATPEHGVFLGNFYIDVYEVTFEQYEKYREAMREAKKRFPPRLKKPLQINLPATGMAWRNALLYARWAGKVLPTEAEWEKAARGREGFIYPWGNGSAIWHVPRSPGQIDLIGTFRGDESPFGVVDMAGNVREWCADWFAPYADALKGGEATLQNPTGPKTSRKNGKVVRGGVAGWELWHRAGVPSAQTSGQIGFRGVLRIVSDPDDE